MRTHRQVVVTLLAVAAAAALSSGKALAAPGWYGATGGFITNGGAALSVPDFYQHQNWVSSGAAVTNPLNGWETVSGQTGGNGGGWCNYTAYADIFYDFYARGITGVYPNPGVNAITNPYNALYGPTNSAANVVQSDIYQIRGAMGATTPKNVQTYLTAQNTGLLSNALTVGKGGTQLDGAGVATTVGRVYYNDPATGGLKSFGMNGFDATNLFLKHLNGNIVYTLLVGTASTAKNANGQGIWWGSSFHNVAVAGVNTTSSLVYIADPDSNLGPGVANAGWPFTNTNFAANAPFSLTSPAGAPRPVPGAPNVATPGSYNTFYNGFAFGNIPLAPGVIGPPAPIANNAIGSFDAPQYNNTVLDRINPVMPNPIRALFGLAKASSVGPATQTTLTVNLPSGADTLDGIIVQPTSTLLNPITDPTFFSVSVPSSPSSIWSSGVVSPLDPFGNTLAFGEVQFNLLSGSPLLPGDDALVNLGTLSPFTTTGYNLLLHFTGDLPTTWLPVMEGGTLFNPSDTARDQLIAVPEPAMLGVATLGLFLLIRRGRRVRV